MGGIHGRYECLQRQGDEDREPQKHRTITQPHTSKSGDKSATRICGTYAFRGPIWIIGEQAPQSNAIGVKKPIFLEFGLHHDHGVHA